MKGWKCGYTSLSSNERKCKDEELVWRKIVTLKLKVNLGLVRFLKYALCPFEYSLKSGKLGIPNGSSCLFSIVLSGAWTDKADGKSST
jgi:hypothetical protein